MLQALRRGVLDGTARSTPTPHKSAADGSSLRFPAILRWGQVFVDLVDNPRVLPLLQAGLGADCRLDHEYAHCLRPNVSGTPVVRGRIHGGNKPGVSCPGGPAGLGTMLSVVYELQCIKPHEGGFGAIAGSHKTSLGLPIAGEPHPVTKQYPALVSRLECHPGAAIVFTESMAHCTLPWQGAGRRDTLFYKYAPRDRAALAGQYTSDYRALKATASRPLRRSLARLLDGLDETQLSDGVTGQRFPGCLKARLWHASSFIHLTDPAAAVAPAVRTHIFQ
jgi:hypothetical protein